MIYIDTSAFFAIFDHDDTNHKSAAQTWISFLNQQESLVCNNYVLLETITLLQRRLGMTAVHDFEKFVALLEVVWVEVAQHQAAMNILLTARRRQLSLVDCTSFGTMRRRDIRTAFTFDAHFAEQGFECIP